MSPPRQLRPPEFAEEGRDNPCLCSGIMIMRMPLYIGLAVSLWMSAAPVATAQTPAGEKPSQGKPERISNMPVLELQTSYAKWQIAQDATTSLLADVASKINYARKTPPAVLAHVTAGGKEYPATSAMRQGENIHLDFGPSGVTAVLKVSAAVD